jgi:sugar phosphate isomerase/epimerase
MKKFAPLEGLRFSVCQSVLCNDDMVSDLDMVVETGTDAVAVHGRMLRSAGVAQTIEALEARSLAVSSYQPGLRILEMTDEDADIALRTDLAAAAAIRAPVMIVSTGPAAGRSSSEADDCLVARLNRVAPLASELGVVMGLEPVHPFLDRAAYVHTLRHAADLVGRTCGVGIALDVVHVYWDRFLFEDITTYIEAIRIVHLGNLSEVALTERRWGRAAVDTGVVPVEAILRGAHQAGYRGYVEDETLIPAKRGECIDAVRRTREWFEALSPSS